MDEWVERREGGREDEHSKGDERVEGAAVSTRLLVLWLHHFEAERFER